MIGAQVRKAVREMMKKGTTSSQPTPIGAINLADSFSGSFNQDALDIFQIQTNSLLYQWNHRNEHSRSYLYGLMELAGLLGIRAADQNPCGALFTRMATPVKFFGVTCEGHQVIPGVNRMIDAINSMAKNKWLKASMYNLGMMELQNEDPSVQTKRFVIFSYLVVDPQYDIDVVNQFGNLLFQEGGLPPEFK